MDGVEVCRQLRKQGLAVPILVLTAQDGVYFGERVYAPGVGLVKDGSLVLISHGRGAP